MGIQRARRVGSGLALLAGIALATAAPAEAQEPSVTIDNTNPVVAQTLAAQPVEFSPNAEPQWLRCESADAASCAAIDGATNLTYVVQPRDAGSRLAVRAEHGDKVAQSPLTEVVLAPPTVTAPAISGDAIVGRTLTASASATGVPAPSVSYQWQRCRPGEACVAVGNAPEYPITGDDAGAVLTVRATAANSVDSVTSGPTSTPAVQVPPQVTSVTITGQAVVGEKLTASADATGTPAPGLTYQWLRCAALLPLACKPIEDATARGYVVASADAGDRLAVRVAAGNPAGEDAAESSPTAVVPQPVRFDQSASPGTESTSTPPSTPPTSRALRYLRPFPVVRLKGFLAPGGARFSLVRVTASRRSNVTVRCEKVTCPVSRRPLRPGRIRALERFLPAGGRITIRVSKPGRVGKFVRVVIRDGSAPKRRDACLLPGDTRPVPCPTA